MDTTMCSFRKSWFIPPSQNGQGHYRVVLKVMDQKALVKRRWSYKVRITVYIWTLGEFARHKSLLLETLPDTFSLFDRNKTQPQTSKTSEQRLASH